MALCFPGGDFVFLDPIPRCISKVMGGQKAFLWFGSFVGVTGRRCFSTGDSGGTL